LDPTARDCHGDRFKATYRVFPWTDWKWTTLGAPLKLHFEHCEGLNAPWEPFRFKRKKLTRLTSTEVFVPPGTFASEGCECT
jgi:hypothetical protein